MSEPRLVDPVHLFDSQGYSLVGYEALRQENEALKEQVVSLMRNNMVLAQRLTALFGEQDDLNEYIIPDDDDDLE